MVRLSPLLSLTVALGLAAAAAACSVSSATTDDQSADDTATADAGTTMPPLQATTNPQIVSTLAGAGLTIDNLPATLDDLTASDPTHAKLHAVMKTFTIALGVDCTGCHATGDGGMPDFEQDTPNKNIARKMWSNFVAELKKADGTSLYCDTCHEGKAKFLDRSNDRALGTWMKTNFVAGLERKDGTAQSCTNCHGNPFNGTFLDGWSQTASN